MVERRNRVQWVYAAKTNEELAERYDQWAAEYDRDLTEAFAWNGPQAAVEVFARHVPRHARILDAGAGTGLVGERLAASGYRNLYAMDLSLGMLERRVRRRYTRSCTA